MAANDPAASTEYRRSRNPLKSNSLFQDLSGSASSFGEEIDNATT